MRSPFTASTRISAENSEVRCLLVVKRWSLQRKDPRGSFRDTFSVDPSTPVRPPVIKCSKRLSAVTFAAGNHPDRPSVHAELAYESTRVHLGGGKGTYERGREVLLQWRMHEGSSWARIVLGQAPVGPNLQARLHLGRNLMCLPQSLLFASISSVSKDCRRPSPALG